MARTNTLPSPATTPTTPTPATPPERADVKGRHEPQNATETALLTKVEADGSTAFLVRDRGFSPAADGTPTTFLVVRAVKWRKRWAADVREWYRCKVLHADGVERLGDPEAPASWAPGKFLSRYSIEEIAPAVEALVDVENAVGSLGAPEADAEIRRIMALPKAQRLGAAALIKDADVRVAVLNHEGLLS